MYVKNANLNSIFCPPPPPHPWSTPLPLLYIAKIGAWKYWLNYEFEKRSAGPWYHMCCVEIIHNVGSNMYNKYRRWLIILTVINSTVQIRLMREIIALEKRFITHMVKKKKMKEKFPASVNETKIVLYLLSSNVAHKEAGALMCP